MSEFPKWVEVHESHVHREEGKPPVVPRFPDFHVARDGGSITVLVTDAEHEARATSPHPEPEKPEIDPGSEPEAQLPLE